MKKGFVTFLMKISFLIQTLAIKIAGSDYKKWQEEANQEIVNKLLSKPL